jgi:hypothetical protein
LKDNNEWKKYVSDVLDPIIELERGKLGEKDSPDSSGSDNNIFDDEFINGGLENNATEDPSEEDNEHKSFMEKIKQCYSNQALCGSNCNHIEIGERESKSRAYAEEINMVADELRNSLCDDAGEKNFKRRDRSTSNENFGLPPLSSDDDYKGLQGDELINNYKSNDGAALLQEQIGHFGEISPEANPDLDIGDVDIDLEDDRKEPAPPVPAFDFFGKELLPDTQEEELLSFQQLQRDTKAESKEFDDIFNQIDELYRTE